MNNQNNLQKYFSDINNSANERYNSMDGVYSNGAFNYAGGDDFYADGAAPLPVTAVAQTTTQGKSQPYIITLQNTTGSAVSSVVIFSAYTALYSTNFGISTSIVVSSGIPNTTYQQLLGQSQLKPFSVGMTYIQSSTTGQILQALSLTTRDANGNTSTQPLVPVVDPYQNQTDSVTLVHPFIIDAFTSITINSVAANCTVNFYFYPQENVNQARALAGNHVPTASGAPGIIKAQPITVRG